MIATEHKKDHAATSRIIAREAATWSKLLHGL